MSESGPREPCWRRAFDIACAALGIVLMAPALALIALLILWDDGLPVVFEQTRVGRYGKYFTIRKFRTMRPRSSGAPITAAGDTRITRIGRWLREFKLDELPQLLNVLKGDMSLIGPRPEVPEFVRIEDPQWQAVLNVRPGITDLATLICRDEERLLSGLLDPVKSYRETILPAKVLLNLEYQRSRTLMRDLRLLALTVRYSFFPESVDPARLRRILGIHGAVYE